MIWFNEINGYKGQEQNIMFTKEYMCEDKFLGDLKPQSRAWFDRGLALGSDLECWAASHLMKVNVKNCILRSLNAMRRAYCYYHFLLLSFSQGLMAHLASNLSDLAHLGWAKLRFHTPQIFT